MRNLRASEVAAPRPRHRPEWSSLETMLYHIGPCASSSGEILVLDHHQSLEISVFPQSPVALLTVNIGKGREGCKEVPGLFFKVWVKRRDGGKISVRFGLIG